MRQAILTKYLAPTNTKGARVKAWCAGGSVTLPWDHGVNGVRNYAAAAHQLAVKLDWMHGNHYFYSTWQGGALPDGTGYCFVQVEVKEDVK